MIRIYIFYTHNNIHTGTFTRDERAKEVAKAINATALFIESDVFNNVPAAIPLTEHEARKSSRWKEIP